MSRARDRPPRLETNVGASQPAPPLTVAEILERAKVVGIGASGPGPTELRRTIERITMGDRRALGEIAPLAALTPGDAWSAVTATFGARSDAATIDATRTLAATAAAVLRVQEVARSGARIALATAAPASLLTLHLAFAGVACAYGGEVVDLSDFGPIRADGRTARWLRWVGGVAVVSDGRALCDTRDGEAAREWVFAIPRPALVVADGPFAEVAWEQGLEVVALSGLGRPALAIARARGGRCTVVPMHTDRPARAYRAIEDLVRAAPARPEPGNSGEPGM